MTELNTLFLLANHGLRKGPETGLLESWMWNLTSEDQTMIFLSLHKSKGVRAHKGGVIVSIRSATYEEVDEHQNFLKDSGLTAMQDVCARKIVVFRLIKNWNVFWPAHAKSNPMAYKATGYVKVKSE